MQLTDIVNRRRMRHAHMVNITPQIMREGMRADFHAVDRHQHARCSTSSSRAKTIRATTPAGSDIRADAGSGTAVDQDERPDLARRSGATCRAARSSRRPGDVNGTFVIDGVVGDWLCDRYGSLKDAPLTVTVDGSRLVEAWSDNRALRDDFWAYTHTDENSDRVGEFAIGTNIGLTTRDRRASCRTRSSRASTSPSAIRTARTPARPGGRPRTSTSSAPSSTSGWTASRSCGRGKFLIELDATR